MVLVLFFLAIIMLIAFLIVLTSVLWIQIDVRNLKLYKEEKIDKRTNNDYEIFIYGYISRKIKIFKYKINNKKISKKYLKKFKNEFDLSILKAFISNNFNLTNVKNIEIESLELHLTLGTENVVFTSGIVTLSNILISILLSKLTTNYSEGKYKYKVKPIYENKNRLELFLESKIRIKLFSFVRAFKSYIKAKRIVV